MEKNNFLNALAEIINVDTSVLSDQYTFADDNWDSLTVMAVVAAIDRVYDKVIPVKKVAKCRNVAELRRLIADGE